MGLRRPSHRHQGPASFSSPFSSPPFLLSFRIVAFRAFPRHEWVSSKEVILSRPPPLQNPSFHCQYLSATATCSKVCQVVYFYSWSLLIHSRQNPRRPPWRESMTSLHTKWWYGPS